MQIRTILRFHLTSVRIAKINKTNDSLWWMMPGKGNTRPLLVKVQTCTTAVAMQEAGNRPSSRHTQRTIIPQERYLLIYSHCISVHNRQKLETATLLIN